jgi:dTDP-4-dehydrorhamnose reductase
VSIIGPGLESVAGLFGWFMQQRGKVKGYTNHLWNGITTLEWAKAALGVIVGSGPQRSGLVQLGVTQRHSKWEMLTLLNEIWDRQVIIEPVAANRDIDRTLEPEWVSKPFREQLLDLKAWMDAAPSRPSVSVPDRVVPLET